MATRQSSASSSSRRSDNPTSSRGERTSTTRSGPTPAVESAVTRLLVAIKQLLEALTHWSQGTIDEEAVSNVYVRLGNDFNAAVAAFVSFGIDMSELISVPDDLRGVLEQCLAEAANQESLDMYLPSVRLIITNLLQGLRGKQSIYRKIVSEQKQKPERSEPVPVPPERVSSQRPHRREPSGHRSQPSQSIPENERPDSPSGIRRSMPSSGSRRREVSQRAASVVNDDFVGGFSPRPMPHSELSGTPDRTSSSSSRRHPSSSSISEFQAPPPPPPLPPPLPVVVTPEDTTSPPSTPYAPSHMKRYSLVDTPAVAPPTLTVQEPESSARALSPPPIPGTPPSMESAPEMTTSLEALEKETLTRRASKRFSTYNISKMTGSVSGRRGNPNRRSLAASGPLTNGDLASLTEEAEEPSSTLAAPSSGLRRANSRSKQSDAPPVPPLPSAASSPEPIHPPPPPETPSPVIVPPPVTTLEPHSSPTPSGSFVVFLQVGREVKKAIIEPGLSFSMLRVLFVDKFSYNPGRENFPAIYIRDPSSGVQYELEDVDEVKEKCLLSLNIEPLDQIKQHIDVQISSLSREIKDLKSTVATNSGQSNRQSMVIPTYVPTEVPAAPRPTDGQFHRVATQISRMVQKNAPAASPIVPQITGQSLQPQMTGTSEFSGRVVADLKTQFDEVQNLRRDLGIMRQLYTEFMKNTKESLGTLRTQTQSVKQLANTKVGGARGFIDSGKTKLDSRSQDLLTKVEELQDTVEGVKDDVVKRHITPKAHVFVGIKEDVDSLATELSSLSEHIKTIKPMWKKTWEEELQNIVEEQQFLEHQEQFLADLLEDHQGVVEVYGHVEKVISLRGTGPTRILRNRSFKPPPIEEAVGGLGNVMLEIRSSAVDAARRMKAIEANQKNRQKEIESRSDEFQQELSGFVGGKKLKMTGGAEEAERLRQKRNDMSLKAMFTGGSSADVSFSSMTSTVSDMGGGDTGSLMPMVFDTLPPSP